MVDPEALTTILDAATRAPAAGNTHGFDLVVLQRFGDGRVLGR